MYNKHAFWLFLLTFLVQPVFSQTAEYSALVKVADSLYRAKNYGQSATTFSKAFAANAYKGMAGDRYNAACSWALSGNVDSSFFQLFYLANKVNYTNLGHLTTDEDLKMLYSDKRWQELVALVKKNKEAEEVNLDKPLVAELEAIYVDDQKYRQQIDSIDKKFGWKSPEMKAHWVIINEKDSLNLLKIRKILDTRGWLGADVVGRQGASTLFLVIQHADIKTQEQYLPMMREAVKNKKASSSSLALLEDRVLLRQGKKQIYGSQIGRKPTGEHYVQALEDPDNVDKRRAEVGLPPLANYVGNWQMKWDVEAYKKELPELEKLLMKY